MADPQSPQFEVVDGPSPQFEVVDPAPPRKRSQVAAALQTPPPDYVKQFQAEHNLPGVAQPPNPVTTAPPTATPWYSPDILGSAHRSGTTQAYQEEPTLSGNPLAQAVTAGRGVSEMLHSGAVPPPASHGPAASLPTPEQGKAAIHAAADITSGTAGATAPFLMPEAIVGRPLATAATLGLGTAASEGAGYVSKKAGASEATQKDLRVLAFAAPMLFAELTGVRGEVGEGGKSAILSAFGDRAGVGAKVTPEGVTVAGKVGPLQGSHTFSRGTPSAPGLEPPTIEGQVLPPDPDATIIAEHDTVMQRAGRVAQGQPPLTPEETPPAPPLISASPNAPPSVKKGSLSADDVSDVAQMIAKLPPGIRAQAMQEAHGTLTKVLMEQGASGKPVVLPNGQMVIIKDQASAEKTALQVMNDAVKDHDQAQAEQAKNATKEAEPAKESPQAVARVSSRQKAADLAAPKFEVVEGKSPRFEIVDSNAEAQPLTEGVESGDADHSEDNATAGGVSVPPREGTAANVPEAAGVQGAGKEVPTSAGTGEAAAVEPTARPLSKGDPVTFSQNLQVRKGEGKSEIIPAGTKAFIEHANAGMNFARVRLADGKVHSVPLRNLEKSNADVRASESEQLGEADRSGSAGSGSMEHGAARSVSPSQTGSTEAVGRGGNGEGAGGTKAEAAVPEHFKSVAKDLPELEKKYDALGTPNYVAGDKAKELLPQWADKEKRGEIEESIHPDASRVGYQLFQRKLARVPPGGNVLLVTGPVAAGKTTFSKEASKHAALTYEVNLSSLGSAKKHIESILAQGAVPNILYVHTTPELSVERRALRAQKDQRPVHIDRSVPQHIDLPKTLATLAEEYGSRINISAVDNSKPGHPEIPVEKLAGLAYTKGKDELLSEQQAKLDQLRDAGTIGDKLHKQLSARQNPGADHAAGPAGVERRGTGSEEGQSVGEPAVERAKAAEPQSDRQKLGLPPERGKVGEMRVRDLTVAPHKFQYKLSTDAEGVGTLLKETKVFNPDLAGVISVWYDPADGKTYVVNGHHRYELAKRTGQKTVTVRHIVAKDAVKARSIGALQNIAEGRGTAVDAAKFFHDSSLTPEDLKERGISLGEKTAADGVAMSRLDPSIFAKVVSGDLRQGRAVAIGEATADQAEQKAILSLVEKKERAGAKVSDDTLSELIRLVKGAEQTTETTANLFGSQEITRSLALEKAEISAHIKAQLAKDKKLFGFVSKGDRATELERGGNKIDVEKSKQISTGAAQAEEVYNKLSARGGPIASILDEAARQLADGDHAGSVKSEAYARVRSEISKTLGGGQEGSTGRSGGTPEDKQDTGPALFSPETQLAPPFYSKAARVAFDKLPASGSGESMLATLRNAGVKADEIKWIGLDDFLKDKPKISKGDVLSYIMRNMVQVREVSKGGSAEPVFREGFPTREAMFTHVMGDEMLWNERQGGLKPGLESRQGPDGKWNLFDSKQPSTKYASYTLPGDKKNYTELLLTLPARPRKVMDTIAKEMGFGGWTNQLTEEQKDRVIAAFDRQPSAHEPFKTAHFEEPNILAHVRFDERTDADGKPMLFVEEVQSDWHQKGKKIGYQQTPMQGKIVETGRGLWRIEWPNGTYSGGYETRESAERAMPERAAMNAKSGVPNAPFKSDWHELAMKTMLRKAAEGGYDKIGWVTGEQTAARYDLSKQIESLNYDPDNQRLVAKLPSGSRHIDKQVPPEQLPDYIGKEAAQRLLATEKNGAGNHELRGTGLKVGGSWAQALYDRAIPNFLSKYGKKWGAKVGETTVPGSGGPETIHSLTVTPEMRASVLTEGQPLFSHASSPIEPAVAKDIAFTVEPTSNGLPSYLRINQAATTALSNVLGPALRGVHIPAQMVPEVATKLKAEADQMAGNNLFIAAGRLRKLANAMIEHTDKESGLVVVRGEANPASELATLHEEMLHAAQAKAGKGNIGNAMPWREVLSDPGIRTLFQYVHHELQSGGITPIRISVAAEGMVDLLRGDAAEHLTPEQIESSSEKFFTEMAAKAGLEALQSIQATQDYIAQRVRDEHISFAEEVVSARNAGQAALTRVISQGTGRASGRNGESLQGQSPSNQGGLDGTPSGGPEGANPPRNAGANGEGESNAGPPKGSSGALHSTQPIGLTDEELADWSKSKGFRSEPAGEQLGMFGDNEPVMRVFRSGPRGHEQKGLVYQSQLERLKEPKPEPAEPFALTGGEAREEQPRLFGAGDMGEIVGNPKAESGIKLPAGSERPTSLFSGERGELEPGKAAGAIANAAGRVGDFLRQEVEDNRRAHNLQWDMYDLDKRHEARVLRARDLLKGLQKDGVTQDDRRAIDEHLDALEADSDHVSVPSLTPKQDEVLDKVLMPMKAEAEEAFQKVTNAGMTIPNYNPRQTKGRGGMLDRFLTPKAEQRTGRGNLLSQTMPAENRRTMMALENSAGKRMVVSLKGGQVTAWKDGTPENLGPIMNTEEGREFLDKDDNIWKLKQATKNEIEKHTNVEYYHDAAASTVVNWLQAKKAEAAHDLVETWKKDPDFQNVAMKTDSGNPPTGWRTTNLPQMKGYYFEPHTAEVLDWFNDRLKSGAPNAFDSINGYMRAKILLNPIKHPLNVGAQWAVDKGATGFLPHRWLKIGRTAARAIGAVINQNDDFKEALDAGGALQSARGATRDLVKTFYEQMAEGAEKGEPWATKLAKAVGMAPVTLVKALHEFSSKIAWPASDMMFLQAAYEYQGDHPGVSLHDALREVGRTIPEYRLPNRIMDSPTLAKVMSSNIGTVFGSYHYGLLKSFTENAKSALGAGTPAPGRTKAEEVGKGWDRLALMALGALAIYPAADQLLKKLTGNKDAEEQRHGIFALLKAASDVAHKEATPTQALTKVMTPNPTTESLVELAFDRDLRTGRKLYDPGADWQTQGSQLMQYLKEQTLPMGSEVERASHTTEGWKKFAWGQAGVNFPKHGPEKLAQQIASSKMDTSAWTREERDRYYARQRALDGLRKGDSKAFEEGIEHGLIRPDEISSLIRRSAGSALYDKVHGFTYDETLRVYNEAVKYKDQEAQQELLPLLIEKMEREQAKGQPIKEPELVGAP